MPADLEIGDTAGLETCATTLQRFMGLMRSYVVGVLVFSSGRWCGRRGGGRRRRDRRRAGLLGRIGEERTAQGVGSSTPYVVPYREFYFR